MYDYSNGIEYRVINLAWVTFRLGVGHNEPIAHSKLDLEVVKLTNPAKTMSTDVQVTQPYEIPKDFSTQEKVVKRLLGEEMSVVRETMRRLLGNHLFCDMKSAEKIKAVIRACPPHIQVKLTHKKVKNYFKNLEVVHTSLQEEHALANKAREIDQSQPHNSEAVLAETGEEEEDNDSEEAEEEGETKEGRQEKHKLTIEEADKRFKEKIKGVTFQMAMQQTANIWFTPSSNIKYRC